MLNIPPHVSDLQSNSDKCAYKQHSKRRKFHIYFKTFHCASTRIKNRLITAAANDLGRKTYRPYIKKSYLHPTFYFAANAVNTGRNDLRTLQSVTCILIDRQLVRWIKANFRLSLYIQCYSVRCNTLSKRVFITEAMHRQRREEVYSWGHFQHAYQFRIMFFT